MNKLYWIYFKNFSLWTHSTEEKTGIRADSEEEARSKFWEKFVGDDVSIVSVELAPEWMNQ